MPQTPDRPILPITIVSLNSGRGRESDPLKGKLRDLVL